MLTLLEIFGGGGGGGARAPPKLPLIYGLARDNVYATSRNASIFLLEKASQRVMAITCTKTSDDEIFIAELQPVSQSLCQTSANHELPSTSMRMQLKYLLKFRCDAGDTVLAERLSKWAKNATYRSKV